VIKLLYGAKSEKIDPAQLQLLSFLGLLVGAAVDGQLKLGEQAGLGVRELTGAPDAR